MNALQEFNFNNSIVRIVVINETPYWIAKDICEYFGDTNHIRSIARISDEDKMLVPVNDSLGRVQNATAINESGLYALLFGFQPEKAQKDDMQYVSPHTQMRIDNLKKFKKWVTSEVLPQIRKTGSYSISIPKTLPEALRAYAAEVEEHEKSKRLLIEQSPKVELADQCLIAVNSRTMGDTAKALNLPGIGRNTLFEILRDERILMDNNLPYQDYINRGWFEVKITPKTHKSVVVNYPTTMVLPKGLEKIRELLNRKVAAL